MSESPIISINNLDKVFPVANGQFYALTQINLNFDKGEFAGFIGPSGSGKTTLLNIIGALDKPTNGIVNVMGNDVAQLTPKASAELRCKHLGFIFQTHNLLPVYTVYENVELPLLLLKISWSERNKRIRETLEWVGLSEKKDQKPPQLSGGQCQRVAIARVMVKRPGIVLADEPTANLDAENSHIVLKTMKQLNQELQTTFLFSTHDQKVINYLDRKITLNDGKVVHEE
ncbi:ABC transporter ATP-binding protein [Deltaproteobacteria bacterium TL4]